MRKIKNKVFTIVKVKSSSMSPLIEEGEKVLLKKTENFRSGDLVGFFSKRGKGVWLVHRVLKITRNGLVTSGDKSKKYDELVNLTKVYGRAEMIKIGKRWKKIDILPLTKLFSFIQSFLIILSIKNPTNKILYDVRLIYSFILRKIIENLG